MWGPHVIYLLPAHAALTSSARSLPATRRRSPTQPPAALHLHAPPLTAGLHRHPCSARARPRRSTHAQSPRHRRPRAPPPARHRHTLRAAAVAPHAAHAATPCTPQPQPTHSDSARKVFDRLPEPRWVARRGRERRLWSRSRSESGPVQRGRPRGPRCWPRPPRSRRQAVLVRSGSGSSQPEVEAGAESEEVGPSGLRLRQLQGQIV